MACQQRSLPLSLKLSLSLSPPFSTHSAISLHFRDSIFALQCHPHTLFTELNFILRVHSIDKNVSSHDRSSHTTVTHAKQTLYNISRLTPKILLNCSFCFFRFDVFVCFLPLICHCWRCHCRGCKTSSHVNAVLN